MGNLFYFVYMILKYAFPMLAPPRIILSDLGPETGNVYTSIIAPLIDSNGNTFYFVFLTIYAAYIGIVIAISMNLIHRRKNLLSYVFYCAVFAWLYNLISTRLLAMQRLSESLLRCGRPGMKNCGL